MKNKNLLFALPLLFGVLLFSCQDEATEATENNIDKVTFNAKVEKAKAIFESKSPDFPVIQSRSADGVEKGIVFEPSWDEAFVSEHNDGSTTVETHVVLSQPFHMLPQESQEAYERTKDSRYMQHLSRTVVLTREEENSEPLAFLMTVVGSKKYMEEHDFQLWEVTYGKIPDDFSGQILYHTLAGDFINGWYVEEGMKFSTCEPISEEEANLLSRAATPGQKVACKTESMMMHYYSCRVSDLYATYEANHVPDTINILNSCTGLRSKEINYQICSLVDDSYLSIGGPNGPVIPYYDLTALFVSYPPELYAQLQGFMNYMNNKDDASRAVLNYIEYIKTSSPGVFQKLNVQIDENQTAGIRVNESNNTVYFKSVSHFSDMDLYEEVVHALQRVVYANYWSGPLNIEFEAKLIIDYMSFVYGSKGNTDMALNMMNASIETQNGSTYTLSDWIRSNSYSYFNVEDFWEFMSVWKSISTDYGNYMISFRMQPQLIFPIIDTIRNI